MSLLGGEKKPEEVPVVTTPENQTYTPPSDGRVSVSEEQYAAVYQDLAKKGYIQPPEEAGSEGAPTRKNTRVKSEYELKEVAIKGTQRFNSTYSDLRPLETTLSFFTDPIEQEINNNFARVWILAAYMAKKKGLKKSAAVDTAIESHIAWLTGKQSKDGKMIDAVFAQQIKQKFQTNLESIFNKAAIVGGSTPQGAPVNPGQQ